MFKNAIVFISICVIVIVLSIGVHLNVGAKQNNNNNKPVPLYVLKDYYGKVAVFKYNSNVPQETLDVYTNTLPKFDQIELSSGVYAYNNNELNNLIEDYDS